MSLFCSAWHPPLQGTSESTPRHLSTFAASRVGPRDTGFTECRLALMLYETRKAMRDWKSSVGFGRVGTALCCFIFDSDQSCRYLLQYSDELGIPSNRALLPQRVRFLSLSPPPQREPIASNIPCERSEEEQPASKRGEGSPSLKEVECYGQDFIRTAAHLGYHLTVRLMPLLEIFASVESPG
jgi:hypothetical protein